MADGELDRRTVLKLLGCSAAGLAGCAEPEAPREGLARLFALQGDEQRWLDALSQTEQADLHRALTGSRPEADARTIRLVLKLLGPRSRLYTFVGYPTAADQPSVCDGLLRE